MQETIKFLNQKETKIKICPNKVRRGLVDFIKPITAGEYLRKKFNLSSKEIEGMLSPFGIKTEYKIRNLGTAHQKVFSIICGFQENLIVIFDYYGLSPHTELQLTEFVKKELGKGKSALSFDNLYYKPEKVDCDKIINLEVRR